MPKQQTVLEVLFTPADFAALKKRGAAGGVCVVFDVLRATTSMLAALSNGAAGIIPVETIAQAVQCRRRNPRILLAGERDGLRILADQTGGIDFDLGNSPREFTPQAVRSRPIAMTTTNGTRALRACEAAERILVSSFPNLEATAGWIDRHRPERLTLVCAGTFEEAAYEDTMAAGALCVRIWKQFAGGAVSDAAQMARNLWLAARENPAVAIRRYSRNARRLLSRPALRGDVAFCLRRDVLELTAELKDGRVIVSES